MISVVVQVLLTMNWEDPNFVDVLRDTLRNLAEDPTRRKPRRELHHVEDVKVTELPECVVGTDPKRYLEWERKIGRMFEFKELDNEKCFSYAILKFSEGASLWFEGLKSKRAREGKWKISLWGSLKRKLQMRYISVNFRITTYRRITKLKKGNMRVGEYINEFKKLSLLGDIEEIEERKMARFLRG